MGPCRRCGKPMDKCRCSRGTPTSKSAVNSLVSLPARLTAENGAKGLLIGEFHETYTTQCPECDGTGVDPSTYPDDERCEECAGNGYHTNKVAVSWTTIKELYKMIVKHMAN